MSMFVRKIGNEKGVTLIETLIALAVIGLIGAAFMSALGTGAKATYIASERTMAESLARSELEYIKSCDFDYSDPPGPYPINPALPNADWELTTSTALVPDREDGLEILQIVTVNVIHEGECVLSLDAYKSNR